MDVCLECDGMIVRASVTALTRCGGRVRTCLLVLIAHHRMTLFVDHAASPWHSFLTKIGSLRW